MAKNKQKKKNKGLGLFILLIFIVLIIFIVVNGIKSYNKVKIISNDITRLEEELKESFSDNTINSDISLAQSDSLYLKINYNSSNEKYLSSSGKVTQPTILEGEINCKLTVEVSVINLNFFDSFVIKFYTNETSFTYSYNFTILPRELTATEVLDNYLNNLYVPSEICFDMELPNNILNSEASWVSSNEEILSNNGTINGSGDVTLFLNLSYNGVTKNKDYLIKVSKDVLDNNKIYDFDDYSKSSYNGVVTYKDLEISNAIKNEASTNKNLKFKVIDDDAYILSTFNNDLEGISFDYQVIDDKAFTKNVNIALFVSSDGIDYNKINDVLITDSDIHNYNYSFLDKYNGYIKVILTSDYSERLICIDNLVLYKKYNANDAKEELLKILPKQVRNDVILPFTTPFGGKVSYEINSPYLNKLGFVSQSEESQEVDVNISIDCNYEIINTSSVIKVSGLNSKTPVEIRFIDLSKFGGYNDCGESTYIKYGDYDILIDGGDDYSLTVDAIEYVIDEYSDDKILDLVIATHPDSDHIGGLDSIINDYEVLKVLEFYGDASTKVYENYKNSVQSENCEVCTSVDSINEVNGCTKKIMISSDGEVYIDILDTTYYESLKNNPRSVVCVLNAYGYRVLFTGDADNGDYEVEKAYMNSVGDIDILKVVHHGTSNGTSSAFLESVDPEVAIICNGNYLGNKHGHPTYEAISRLYDYDPNMLVYAITGGDSEECTLGTSYKCSPSNYLLNRNGTITIIIDNNGYNISSEYYNDNPIEIKDTDFYKSRVALEN